MLCHTQALLADILNAYRTLIYRQHLTLPQDQSAGPDQN